MSFAQVKEQPQVFGHPAGLYTLFFAEMWERFSYYGMRALLIFYMLKGFLGYGDTQAYTVYGAYTALVYMTPFIGGMLADKVLGKRIAVVIGGLLMAAGHLLMTIQSEWPFFFALALLICGNGFFKPNISTTVGSLYPDGDKRRDAGFNIFYTGINLGAAMSPLICGYVGETYGWHYGFGLATIGMLIGLAVFVMPNIVTSILVMMGAIASSIGLLVFRPDNIWAISINIFVAVCLVIAAVIACRALAKGGLPKWAGGRPEGVTSKHDWKIYTGIAIAIPVFALLVSGFSPFMTADTSGLKTNEERLTERVEFLNEFNVDPSVIDAVNKTGIEGEMVARGKPFQLIPSETIDQVKGIVDKNEIEQLVMQHLGVAGDALGDKTFADLNLDEAKTKSLFDALSAEYGVDFPTEKAEEFTTVDDTVTYMTNSRASFVGTIAGIFLEEVSKPAGMVLTVLGLLAFGYLIKETFKLEKVPRERMMAALVLIFFQMLFFAFFEQAGSSVNNFTDRNIDRVGESDIVSQDQVGQTIRLEPTQAQLGYMRDDTPFTLSDLDDLRKIVRENPDVDNIDISWTITEDNVGMGIAKRLDELPASIFQSFNAIFILLFALVFNWIWSTLRKRNLDPSAPVKFGLGLIQLGMGFGAFWMGAQYCNTLGMVALGWLTLGILFQTTGELCLSPVGLSTMTKLSPKVLVSTLMGAWFLATAFSQYLAAIISQFTSVKDSGGSSSSFPTPLETVNTYGDVFGNIALTAMGCGLFCIMLSPILTRWMHQDKSFFDHDEKQA